jgi:hypothetical protein
MDKAQTAAVNAAKAAGYDGTSADPVARLLFALADVLGEHYSLADIAQLYRNVADRLDILAKRGKN